jgi:hypothetical protein
MSRRSTICVWRTDSEEKNSLIYERELEDQQFPKREGTEFRAKVNLNKEQ